MSNRKTTGDTAMSIYHKHHIVPKHMGGSDESSNIIRLTLEEHAEEHLKLYKKYGKIEDQIAWQALTSMITKQEAIIKLQKNAQRKGGIKSAELYPEKASLGGKALWAKEGMREHLRAKRIEQSLIGKHPMQGKKQNRVCCFFCKKEYAYNVFVKHCKKSPFCF
jgi:hypothetical protein